MTTEDTSPSTTKLDLSGVVTAYVAAEECAAVLRKATALVDSSAADRSVLLPWYATIAEGWRALAQTMSGGGRGEMIHFHQSNRAKPTNATD